MNAHDIRLIDEAEQLSYTDWMLIDETKAETEEGRKRLHIIQMKLYHKEEDSSGLL